MRTILDLFFLPPMAVARVGGSNTPLEAYRWRDNKSVYGGHLTIIVPAVSFRIAEDGSIAPYMPETPFRFRDGPDIRPVAPFFELWARVQDPDDGSISEEPLTLELMKDAGIRRDAIAFRIIAGNQKASMRTGDAACSFTARLEINGTDHSRHELLAYSRHNPGEEPLVFKDKPVPLGAFQVIRPKTGTEMGIDCGVVRVRFTPGKGEVYGPPSAVAGPASPLPPGDEAPAQTEYGRLHEIVPPENRILNENATWTRYAQLAKDHDDPQPADSYDGANVGNNQSWGVVDDTCDAVITANIVVAGQRFSASTRVLVGPPDFAPDRRPFYSCADDLADRDLENLDIEGDLELSQEEISDLFNRVFETVSLMNVDAVRTRAILENAGTAGAKNFDGLPKIDKRSLTIDDKPYVDKSPELLQSDEPQLESRSVPHDRLPYSQAAAFVHTPLAEMDVMLEFLRSHADHVRKLIRPAYPRFKEYEENPDHDAPPNDHHRDPRNARDLLYDMRMPPYMRDSDESPLSLTRRQYRALMDLVDALENSEEAGT